MEEIEMSNDYQVILKIRLSVRNCNGNYDAYEKAKKVLIECIPKDKNLQIEYLDAAY